MVDDRLEMADRLIEEAEHSSEVAMRTSLSRAYYALYHLGITVTGKSNHGEIREALKQKDRWLGDEYGYFMDLRTKADYDPGFVYRQYGDIKQFKVAFTDDMARARELFERLREETRKTDDIN